jgi:hypothetical protein
MGCSLNLTGCDWFSPSSSPPQQQQTPSLMSRPPEGFAEKYGTEELFPVSTRPRVVECIRRFAVPVDAGGPSLDEIFDGLVKQHTDAP